MNIPSGKVPISVKLYDLAECVEADAHDIRDLAESYSLDEFGAVSERLLQAASELRQLETKALRLERTYGG